MKQYPILAYVAIQYNDTTLMTINYNHPRVDVLNLKGWQGTGLDYSGRSGLGR